MCTVSWLAHPGGYDLFFNRDERRIRSAGHPPAAHCRQGVACVHPTDPESGGTWIGANEKGLALALMNHYPLHASEARAGRRSRGLVVLSALHLDGTDDAFAEVERGDLERYAPFVLVGIEPGGLLRALSWDGRETARRAIENPPALSTSSFEAGRVVASRLRCLETLTGEAGGALSVAVLAAYHLGHLPERGASSVCMHRAHARTVSHTRVSVTEDQVRMAYADGPPCRNPLLAPCVLAR